MTTEPEALHVADLLELQWQREAEVAAALGEQHAEIERLRTEVERLDLNGIHSCHDTCRRLPCVQRREIERLRGVLRGIAANTCCEPCQEAALVAKAALKEGER